MTLDDDTAPEHEHEAEPVTVRQVADRLDALLHQHRDRWQRCPAALGRVDGAAMALRALADGDLVRVIPRLAAGRSYPDDQDHPGAGPFPFPAPGPAR